MELIYLKVRKEAECLVNVNALMVIIIIIINLFLSSYTEAPALLFWCNFTYKCYFEIILDVDSHLKVKEESMLVFAIIKIALP